MPVIDVADLIVAKVLAGRPKDIEDVAALWRLHGARIDAARVRATLRTLDQALARNDLLPAFDVATSSRTR